MRVVKGGGGGSGCRGGGRVLKMVIAVYEVVPVSGRRKVSFTEEMM